MDRLERPSRSRLLSLAIETVTFGLLRPASIRYWHPPAPSLVLLYSIGILLAC